MTERFPNIILVVLDTAKRDRFGCYGGPENVTPNVDGLARDGVLVDTMISNAPWTPSAHGSLFTGLYPSEHGCEWGRMRVGESVPVTLAELLQGLGYRTVCATANGMIAEATGLTRGFDTYTYRDSLEGRGGRIARRLTKLFVGGDSGGRTINRWLASLPLQPERPYCLYVNYFEPHWAYVPPLRLARRVGGPRFRPFEGLWFRATQAHRFGPWEAITRADDRRRAIYETLYTGEVANADRFLGRLLEAFDARGLLDNSLVIVTSDHGEHIGEHGLAEHQASLCDHLIRVPFVVHGPGLVSSGRKTGPFEFVDVISSLARLLRVPVPEHLASRRDDLFVSTTTTANAPYTFAEWRSWDATGKAWLMRNNPSYDFSSLGRDLACVREDRFKLVRASGVDDTLFDLKDDPSETSDATRQHPTVVARLGKELDVITELWNREWDSTTDVSSEERREIEERLSGLGYI